MAKIALDVTRIARLINHGPTVLASCCDGNVRNIITLAWATPVSIEPPMVAIAVAPARFSHQLIERSGEFAINVPGSVLLPAVWYCGTHSGREGDKFDAAGLTGSDAASISAPLVAECFAHIECSITDSPTVGDHTLFVGEAVSARIEEDAFDGHLRLAEPYNTLHHLGGTRFVTTGGETLSAA